MYPQTQYYSESQKSFHVDYVKTSDPFIMYNYHYHNAYEILYFQEGEQMFFLRDRIYHITAGNLVLINKYELHSIRDWDKPGHSRVFISFREDFFNSINTYGFDLLSCYKKDIVVIDPSIRHQQILFRKTMDIVREAESKKRGYEICIRAKTMDLLIFIDRILDQYHDKTDITSPRHNIINDVMMYIADNYKEKLTLDMISREFGYSKNYLCTTFKQVSGLSMNQYINAIRIKEAQKLLKNTDYSITQISELTGFDSITHFGRVFKSITGYTPLKFRKDQRFT
ncbi:MAG: AraC family transcriptional regulator [Clostridiales bacterium]|nr:AraC family transcriptional regulator [Clostridiales bacterium]